MDKRRKEFRDFDHYSKDEQRNNKAVEKRKRTKEEKYTKEEISESLKTSISKWYETQRDFLNTLEIIPKEKITSFLKNKRELYVGKSGNRKLIKDDPCVYNSLNHYCEEFTEFFHNKEFPFVCKLDIALSDFVITSDMMCLCGKTLKFNRLTQKWDKFYCKQCRKSPTSKEHFKIKYGSGWEVKWRECMVNSNNITKGKNEKYCLDKMEKLFNTKIDRDFSVSYYFPDGYSHDLNIVFEVNEKHHRLPSNIKKDNKRRKIIQKELKCDFIVIWDDTMEIERKKYV